MGVDKADLNELNLWKQQRAAVVDAEAYLSSPSPRGCLVQMPTGTGKTGVISVLGTRRAARDPVLVVCPSAALVRQLMDDLKEGFWKKIGADPKWRPETVVQLLPSNVDEISNLLHTEKARRIIVVGTIQALQQIDEQTIANKLHGLIGTLIFDEGHREPAPSWSRVVRGLGVKTVLFSATPFRGDMKVFDIGDDNIHFLSFEEAAKAYLIRDVEVVERQLPNDPSGFAQAAIAERARLIANGRFRRTDKMIIRAASEESVAELYQAFLKFLHGTGDRVLAVHHNFGSGDTQMQGEVPADLRTRQERFLIHQYMLTEGIDDPSCTMLAMFEPFETERMLVQQIGRLTRHPGPIGEAIAPAHVLARVGDGVLESWQRFLNFDRACVANGGKPPIRNSSKVLQELVKALPEMDYVGGKFRERINLENIDYADDLLVPQSVIVFDLNSSPTLDSIEAEVSSALLDEDRFEHYVGRVDESCRYHISLRLVQSPFLTVSLFHAASLEVTIYTKVGNRLFLYDSAGLWLDESKGVERRVGPRALRALMPVGRDNSISFVSIKNTDLGPLVVRSRTMAARSLERVGSFMGEHLNVVTRAGGRIGGVRRSIGFSRGRIREGEGPSVKPAEFAIWCQGLGNELDTRRSIAPVLLRFAIPAATPANTDPKNILIDMQELLGEFQYQNGTTVDFDQESLCVDIVPDGAPGAQGSFRFELKLDAKTIAVWISWDPKKGKYWLVSPGLSEVKAKDNDRVSLTKRLNQGQPFRIICGDYEHVYVHGAFYALDLDLTTPDGPGRLVLDLVSPVKGLAELKSEKGSPDGKLKTWPSGSLFRFIDDALRPKSKVAQFGERFPVLVCDDLGTEVADFIAADDGSYETMRAVFVVAKCEKGEPGVSASAFYDVCAQGVKNLAYIKSDGVALPGRANKWDKPWKMTSGKGPNKKTAEIPRLRLGNDSKAVRTLLSAVKSTPTATRAIWLVCAGGMLSKSALEREFKKKPPQAHVLQFYHLVLSAFSSCQSVGVELKIFASE